MHLRVTHHSYCQHADTDVTADNFLVAYHIPGPVSEFRATDSRVVELSHQVKRRCLRLTRLSWTRSPTCSLYVWSSEMDTRRIHTLRRNVQMSAPLAVFTTSYSWLLLHTAKLPRDSRILWYCHRRYTPAHFVDGLPHFPQLRRVSHDRPPPPEVWNRSAHLKHTCLSREQAPIPAA